MSLSLSDYSQMVRDQIAIIEHDVEPQYLPNLREVRDGSVFCLDVLQSHFSTLMKMGGVQTHSGLSRVFNEAFDILISNVKKHQRWSFWHYTMVCVITSLPYAEMISKGEHKTFALDNPKNWEDPDVRLAVLFFNYVAGRLYPDALPKIIDKEGFDKVFSRNESTTERYAFFCKFLIRQIKLVTNELND